MGLIMNLLFTGVLVLAVHVFAPAIIGLFITAPAVAAMAGHLLDIVAWSFLILGVVPVFAGVMRASGDVIFPTLLSFLAIVAVEMPVAMALNRSLGVNEIWLGYPSANVAMAVL